MGVPLVALISRRTSLPDFDGFNEFDDRFRSSGNGAPGGYDATTTTGIADVTGVTGVTSAADRGAWCPTFT